MIRQAGMNPELTRWNNPGTACAAKVTRGAYENDDLRIPRTDP